MKNKFKQSEIDKIPEDWDTMKLGDITALFHNGIWGDDPMPNFISYPVIRSTEITCDGKIDLSTVAYRKIPEDKVNKFTLDEGDILLVASSGSPDLIGRAALFRQPDDDRVYLFSNFMLRIRPQKIDPNFLFYLLSSQHYYHFLKSLQQTSTGLRNLPKKNFLNFAIPYPSLPEQQKIAEILGTVDEMIEKVGKAIEKTERLKKGLMQELLTEGIGHKEFKDTEIGRIPKEWEVVRLGDERIVTLIMGQSPPSSTYNKDKIGLPFLQGKMEFGEIYPTPEFYCSKPIKIANSEDILLSVRAPVGEVNIASSDCCIGRGLAAIRVKKGYLHHLFLFHYLKFYGNKLSQISAGSTFKAIRKQEIENFQIPLPSFAEQKKITEILDSIDERLALYGQKKQRFEVIKKGLMNDLLTGKKRVTP